MKKNKMMRLASVLLIVVLLSCSIIGGTFAKYVTVDSGSDSATVAKWGVSVNINDQLGAFKTEYKNADDKVTVKSTTGNVVAPGTSGYMTFTISGTPEVATRVVVEAESTKTIHLPAADYTLPAGKFAAGESKVTTTADYEPIKFYFGTDAYNTLGTDDYTLTLDKLLEEIEKLNADFFEPGTTLDKTYTLAWSWAFENSVTGTFDGGAPYAGAKVVDFLDTFLTTQTPLQTEDLTITVRIEQVD